MRLSDSIETFIKEMLTPGEPSVELKRNDLAAYFGCTPSQINYVLSTRFTLDDGYMIESRRGGGGYIRIVRVMQGGRQRLSWLIQERIGNELTENDAVRLIGQLARDGVVQPREATLMRAAVSAQALAVPMPEAVKNAARARMLKTMLITLAQDQRPGPEAPAAETPGEA